MEHFMAQYSDLRFAPQIVYISSFDQVESNVTLFKSEKTESSKISEIIQVKQIN